MPESELAKEVTELVKRADKLVRDIKKDTANLLEAAMELKQHLTGREDEEEKGE